MRRLATIILAFALAPFAFGQQTITVDTCTYVPSTGALTINGVQVNTLSLTQLSLTGGTAYGAGVYSVSIASGGAVTLVPVVTSTATPSTGKTYAVTLNSTSGTSWTLVAGITLQSGQQATVAPVSSHTGPPVPADWFYYSSVRVQPDSTGAVYIGLSNQTSTAITGAKVVVTVQ